MVITVRLFASYAEALGSETLSVELPGGATVADCVAAVRSGAAAARLPPSPLVAVNQRYARLDHALSEGDEVALIPPVAGG